MVGDSSQMLRVEMRLQVFTAPNLPWEDSMQNGHDRVEAVPSPSSFSIPDPTTALFLACIEQAFNGSDERFSAAIDELRRSSDVLETARQLYDSIPDDEMFRWSVVYVASQA